MEDRAALRDICPAVVRVVGLFNVWCEVLVGGAATPIYIGNYHTISRSARPRLVCVASEDVPLVFQAGLRINYDLIAVANHGVR